MKSIKQLGIPFLLLMLAVCSMNASYGQSKKEKKAQKEAEIRNLIDSQKFVFKAQTAFPMGRRSINLTTDYDLNVSKETVISYLPYFGRAYSATPGGTSNGLDFTSKDFEYTVNENKKKDGWDIVIKPKDTQQAREMLLTAFKNGSANLQVTSNDKQNISFSGYITAPRPKKS